MKKQIGFLLLSVLIVGNGYAGERYYVQKVKDGDTIIVSKLGNNRAEMLEVRLSDIDAPETTKGKRRPGQPYSRMATNALAAEVLNKEVELRCYGLDRNQRSICHVYAEGEDVGLKLVEAGLAWAATYNMKFVPISKPYLQSSWPSQHGEACGQTRASPLPLGFGDGSVGAKAVASELGVSSKSTTMMIPA